MKIISYTRNGSNGFGAVFDDGIMDLSSRLSCSDLGEALRRHGQEAIFKLVSNKAVDFPLTGDGGISGYRAAVADPNQIFCVGLNYEEHRVEANRQKTEKPTVFLRLASSQTGHQQSLIIPKESGNLDYEGEIAIVIGKGGRRIAADRAFDHIFGFSCYNDGSVRDWQGHTTQWTPGKNFPGSGAFGPAIVCTDEIAESDILTLTTRLNGEVLQNATTDMLIFSIPELIFYISTFAPLQPGDVIVTGTPGGVGFKRQPPIYLKPGDQIEVEVSKVGVLRNSVQLEKE